jgi:cytoplasmic iron level regulating protein YaaA (DUF328/UPF0246 family)
MAALRAAMRRPEAELATLLGVKGEALAAAVAANRAVADAPTMPAIDRYSGVLYDALDAPTLSSRDRGRLRRQVVVVSGLLGLVGPADPVPDHKLKMSATLAPLGRLATWWRAPLTEALAPVVDRRVVWDLLPGEHRAAWAPAIGGPGGPARTISVRFLDETPSRDGERRFTSVSHWNKLLKGSLVRHVLAHQLVDPTGLAGFEHPQGYTYDPGLTEDDGGRITAVMVRPAR